MPSKIVKFSRIFRYRKNIKSYLNTLIFEEKLNSTLNRFNIHKFPEITISDLLNHFKYNETGSITVKTDFSDGISPVNDYYFLSLIARAAGVKKYFEFGTWVGLSSYNIALNLSQDAEIYSLDIPSDHREIAEYNIPLHIFGHYSKTLKNVRFLKCDSKYFDYKPYSKQFDMVFVDGNHSSIYVKNDSQIAFELLKNESSVIAWHDYLLMGDVNKNILAGILDAIPLNQHRHIYHIAQSNMCVYSKSFNFLPKERPKWKLPAKIFNIQMDLEDNNE